MSKEKPTRKDWIMVPIVILVALMSLPFIWLRRKFEGKNLSHTHLLVTADEMRAIEEASNGKRPIMVNDETVLLKPFDAEQQHIHSNCGSCPDELHLDDVKDRPRLTASRETGGGMWKMAAMEPILFGLLGHTSSDLASLRIGDVSIGRADDLSGRS